MVTRRKLSLYRSLSRREARDEAGIYLVEGVRLVEEALSSAAEVQEVLVTEKLEKSPQGARVLKAARAAGVPVERISAADLRRISDTKSPQGAVAAVGRREPDSTVLSAGELFLALDGVADPGNVGTLIRAADAFGVEAVIAGPESAGFENPKVLRAAMGSTFHVELFSVSDLSAELRALRRRGVCVVAAVLDGQDLYRFDVAEPGLCLVLGNEGRGISKRVLSVADVRLTVPCPGRAESLNVAVAGAVLLSRLCTLAREGAV